MLFMNECEIALIDVILIKVQFDTFIYSNGTVTNTKALTSFTVHISANLYIVFTFHHLLTY